MASTPQKPFIVSQIRRVNREIAHKQRELDACLGAAGCQSLAAVFSGKATLTTTNSAAPGPFVGPVDIGLYFGCSRATFLITGFSPITTQPFTTPVGQNVTTVSLSRTGTGTFDQVTGNMGIALSLLFDHSIDLPFYEEDSVLPLLLGTGSIGGLSGSSCRPR